MRRHAFRPYLLVVWAVIVIIGSLIGVEPVSLAVIGVAGTLLAIPISFLWPATNEIPHKLLNNAFAVPVSLVLIASVIFTQWPLRLHFWLARPTLNTIASRVERGEKVRTPIQVGFFRIRKAEINRHDVTCLWLYPDPGGYSGLVKTQSDTVESEFNVWSTVKLSQNWQFISED